MSKKNKEIKSEMPKVYVAGPMRGIAEFNFPAFGRAAGKLEANGWLVFSPADHDIEGGFDTVGMTGNEDLERLGFDLREALKWDLDRVMESDVVALLPGYENSTGAGAEIALAKALGIPTAPIDELTAKQPPSVIETLNMMNAGTRPKTNAVRWLEEERKRSEIDKRIKALTPAPKEFAVGGMVTGGRIYDPKINIELTRAAVNSVISPTFNRAIGNVIQDKSLTSTSDKFVKGSEVRSVSSTGGEKGTKDARFDLIPADALFQLAEHYGFGARKYDDNQWRKGYEYSKSYAAMQRHLNAWWGGEDTDEETGSSHLSAAAWHCFTLLTFMKDYPEFDDRYTK